MTSTANSPSPNPPAPEPLPLSLLNDYLYCPRRAALKVVEGWRSANQHTARGDIVHEHSDLPGYEVVEGVTLLRALPVWSERLRLNGKCDIVEQRKDGSLLPVEFKVGKRRKWGNDDAQLCAQALCLEEMFGVTVPRGAIFHADSKRRRGVEINAELRASTEKAAADLQALVQPSEVITREFDMSHSESPTQPMPAAVFKPACEECSLFDICLPKATEASGRAARLARNLFETD